MVVGNEVNVAPAVLDAVEGKKAYEAPALVEHGTWTETTRPGAGGTE